MIHNTTKIFDVMVYQKKIVEQLEVQAMDTGHITQMCYSLEGIA